MDFQAKMGLKRSMPCTDLISLIHPTMDGGKVMDYCSTGYGRGDTASSLLYSHNLEQQKLLEDAFDSLIRETERQLSNNAHNNKRRCLEKSSSSSLSCFIDSPATAALEAVLTDSSESESEDSEEDVLDTALDFDLFSTFLAPSPMKSVPTMTPSYTGACKVQEYQEIGVSHMTCGFSRLTTTAGRP